MPPSGALRKHLSIQVAAGLLLATLATVPVKANAASETICDRVTLATTNFTDVVDTDVHKPHIVCAVELDIVTPASTQQFGSFTTVTRGEAAEFLTRFIAKTVNPLTPNSVPITFTDIAAHPNETAIRLLAQHGITRGITPTRFAPNTPITRGQFATLLFNASIAIGANFPEHTALTFDDVATASPHALFTAQITNGRSTNRFAPASPLRRGQAATLLTRAAVHLDTQTLWDRALAPVQNPGAPDPNQGGQGAGPAVLALTYPDTELPSSAPVTNLPAQVTGGTPQTFTVSGELPPGVTFDTATGEFTGTFSTDTSPAIGLGGGVSCMVLPDTTIRCAGTNDLALGDGTSTNRSSPVAVLSSGTIAGNNAVVFTGARQVKTGGSHSCALMIDTTVWCWGKNTTGALGTGNTEQMLAQSLHPRPVVTTGTDPNANRLTGVVQLAIGSFTSCAVMEDTTVRCWGQGTGGALGNGQTSASPHPVEVTGLTGVSRISLGSGYGCAVLTSGEARCWGANGEGQLGDGTQTNSLTPVAVLASGTVTDGNDVALTGITRITAGGASSLGHTCASVTTNTNQDDMLCWGAGDTGQLGDGVPAGNVADPNHRRLHPHRVSLPYHTSGQPLTITGIAAASRHTCVTLNHAGINGEAWCFGRNDSSGRLGIGSPSTAIFSTPVPVLASGNRDTNPVALSGASNLDAGTVMTCVTVAAELRCWGSNSSGQMGIGPTGTPPPAVSRPAPAFTGFAPAPAMTPNTNATAISVGEEHACAILADQTVRCWGRNHVGQLGNNTIADSNVPVRVGGATPLQNVAALASGNAHTCAVLTNGTVQCWGANSSRQLGDGTITGRLTPVAVPGITTATAVTAGGAHTCVLLANSQAQCWGGNGSGQIGDGTTTAATIPTTVLASTGPDVPLTGIVQISAGTSYTCALLSDGTARCWGSNSGGRLGNGTATQSLLPTTVLASGTPDVDPVPFTGITHIATGTSHACAVRTDNTAWCWGSGSTIGRLGDGNTGNVNRANPVQVLTGDITDPTPLTDVQAISIRVDHSCVLRTDQTASCWGSNGFGRLGDGTQDTRPIAVPVLFSGTQAAENAVRAEQFSAVSAGGSQSCGITNGSLKCWGIGSFGRLGNGANISSDYPVTVRAIGSIWTVVVTVTDSDGNTASTTVSLTITG